MVKHKQEEQSSGLQSPCKCEVGKETCYNASLRKQILSSCRKLALEISHNGKFWVWFGDPVPKNKVEEQQRKILTSLDFHMHLNTYIHRYTQEIIKIKNSSYKDHINRIRQIAIVGVKYWEIMYLTWVTFRTHGEELFKT